MKNWRSNLSKLLFIKKLGIYQTQKGLAEQEMRQQWLADRMVSLLQEINTTELAILETDDQAKQAHLHTYLTELNQTLPALENEIEKIKIECLRCKEALQEKLKERKIIENIYQTRYTEWRKDVFRRHNE